MKKTSARLSEMIAYWVELWLDWVAENDATLRYGM